ncbi:MAG TPA: hypothetical protein VLK85_33875, partial [Ramlibacter sp.]|nr:hypothetical protein [Ramlibacter sp.]
MASRPPAAAKPRKIAKAAAPAPAAEPAAAPAGAGEPRPADRLSFLIHEISARIAALGNRHFREHGLNHFSARILVLLLE